MLEVGDWTARFITPAGNQDSNEAKPSPLFRKEFEVGKGLIKARLYITALGLYEAQLNGIRFGDQILSPGWTSYQSCLRNQTFDVTNQLREGRNVIGAMLGEGWYS